MAQHEEIHVSQFPGSMVGQIFADQMEVTIRHHALESGCFVVNATGWLADLVRQRIPQYIDYVESHLLDFDIHHAHDGMSGPRWPTFDRKDRFALLSERFIIWMDSPIRFSPKHSGDRS
jgi:predicted amidohydrolase